MWRSLQSIWIWSQYPLTKASIRLTWPSSSMFAWMYSALRQAVPLPSTEFLFSTKRSFYTAAKAMWKCSAPIVSWRIWTPRMLPVSCQKQPYRWLSQSHCPHVCAIAAAVAASPAAGFQSVSAAGSEENLKRALSAGRFTWPSVCSPLYRLCAMFKCWSRLMISVSQGRNASPHPITRVSCFGGSNSPPMSSSRPELATTAVAAAAKSVTAKSTKCPASFQPEIRNRPLFQKGGRFSVFSKMDVPSF